MVSTNTRVKWWSFTGSKALKLISILGSFCADTWDCVATCFFIDTAHNVIDYIDTIWKILKPGGIWINVGKCDQLLFWTYFWSYTWKVCVNNCVYAVNGMDRKIRDWKLSQKCSKYVHTFASYNQVNTVWFLNRQVSLASDRFCIHALTLVFITNVIFCVVFCYFSEKTEL